jgi:hypothetical protein
MSKEKQTTKPLTREQKLEKVYYCICRGLDRASILAYAEEKNWPDKEPAIDGFIAEAQAKLIEAAANIDPEAERGKSIARLNFLYQEATKCQDHKTALSIQKEINRMLEKLRPAPAARSQEQSTSRRAIRLVK